MSKRLGKCIETATSYILGERRPLDRTVFMAFDGTSAYGETWCASVAERFESIKQLRYCIKTDSDVRDWVCNHPDAEIMKLKTGYTVRSVRKLMSNRKRKGK